MVVGVDYESVVLMYDAAVIEICENASMVYVLDRTGDCDAQDVPLPSYCEVEVVRVSNMVKACYSLGITLLIDSDETTVQKCINSGIAAIQVAV